jgi:hypothetical protein
MISQALIEKFAQAIAHAEGFFVSNSVPNRSQNPGDLAEGDIGSGIIQTGGPNGAKITIFPSLTDGWAALYRQVRRMLSGASDVYTLDMTMEQVAMKYSGDPNWATNVCAFLSPVGALTVTGQTTIAEIANADLQAQGTESAT